MGLRASNLTPSTCSRWASLGFRWEPHDDKTALQASAGQVAQRLGDIRALPSLLGQLLALVVLPAAEGPVSSAWRGSPPREPKPGLLAPCRRQCR
eukprot:868851-Pyramimonas_sp.AAC.1